MRPQARTHLALLAPLLLVAALVATSHSATQELTTSAAADHVGEKATVCGEVASTHYAASSRGRPTFLNLDEPYPDPGSSAVVRASPETPLLNLPRSGVSTQFDVQLRPSGRSTHHFPRRVTP